MNQVTIADMLTVIKETRDSRFSSNEVKARFESRTTAEYDARVRTWLPDYEEVNEILLAAMQPFVPDKATLLDLGAGTGRFSKQVLERFPDAHLTLVDFSDHMLAGTSKSMGMYNGRFNTLTADIFSDSLDFEPASFDCIVSTFAIHHGRSVAVYANLYQKIYRWLKPGGCFLCCDHVAGGNDYLTAMNLASWYTFISSKLPEHVNDQFIDGACREDSPLPLQQHFQLLTNAGFGTIDTLWKKQIFGIYISIKE
jgi:tRNA (cmo5U34)-methyltransferase